MKPKHWPARWTQKHGAIYYQVPTNVREKWEGKAWFKLGRTEAEAFVKWYTRLETGGDGAPTTIGIAMDRYMREMLPILAVHTQDDYRRAVALLRPVFGHMRPDVLLPKHVYQYMAQRPRVRANREKAVLSSIMSACVRWGAVDRNLVREVTRNQETPRDRYVTDHELDAFLVHATPMIKAYVRLRMLTGLRQGQILALQRSNWDGERLTVPGAKAGRTVVYSGPGLAEAIAKVLELGGKVRSAVYLLSSRAGSRYSRDGFSSIWQRCMKKHVAAGGARFAENDLRAKVASDSQDLATASARLGHQSEQTTKRVYRRKPVETQVLDLGIDRKTVSPK